MEQICAASSERESGQYTLIIPHREIQLTTQDSLT